MLEFFFVFYTKYTSWHFGFLCKKVHKNPNPFDASAGLTTYGHHHKRLGANRTMMKSTRLWRQLRSPVLVRCLVMTTTWRAATLLSAEQQPGNHHAHAKFLFLAAAIGAAEVQPKLLMSRRTPHPKSLRRLRRPWMFPKTRLLHQRLIHSPPTSIRHAPPRLAYHSPRKSR